MAFAGAPSGTIILADRQEKGRGRKGRSWISPAGNFYASIILRPDCSIGESAGLSLLSGVALGESLLELGPKGLDLALKWPNDILINGAKVAGILLENQGGKTGRIDFVVIGTGVNINSCPIEMAYPVTSLDQAGFSPLSPLDLLAVYAAKLRNLA